MNAGRQVVVRPIRPKTVHDLERLWRGLQALGSDDRTFQAYTNRSGQMFLAGMGELHLQVIIDCLKSHFGLDIAAGKAEVAYRETITADADGEATYVSYADGRGHYVHVKLHLSPGEPSTGYVFASREPTVADATSRAIEKGVRDVMMAGSLAGCPMDDLRVDLCDVSSGESVASEEAFSAAGAAACRDGVNKARPVLLEPIVRVEINLPDEFAPDVTTDLEQRGAEWQSDEVRRSTRVIVVRAPMSRMLGYGDDLRRRTDGRGAHSMRLDGYQRVTR